MSAMVKQYVCVGAVHICTRNGWGGRHLRYVENVPNWGHDPMGTRSPRGTRPRLEKGVLPSLEVT
mgnify:CR=1 FL=1